MIAKEQLQIVSQLRKNARASLMAMSKTIGMPHSTIHQKVKDFEGNIIRKHTTLIDFKKLGFLSHCFLIVKVKKEYREALKTHFLQHKNTNSFFRTNGEYDFLVEIIFQDIGEQKEFTEEIIQHFGAEIQKVDVIEPLFQEGFLTDLSQFSHNELI